MKRTLLLLLVLTLISFAGMGKDCNRKVSVDKEYKNLSIKNYPREFGFTYTTPKGALVASVVEVPDTALADIDAGIDLLFKAQDAAFPDWKMVRAHSNFKIAFIPPQATNMDGSPAVLVHGTQSAGTVLGLGDGFPLVTIVAPHQAATNWQYRDYLKHSVWFEGEHVREYFHDRRMFFNFAHSGDVHPHTPLPSLPFDLFNSIPVKDALPLVCVFPVKRK